MKLLFRLWPFLFWGGIASVSCEQELSMCIEYYGNGKVKYEVPCDLSTYSYQGEYREYHKSGKLWKRKFFVNNLEEDTTRYFFYRTGKLLKSIPMRKGKRHGLSQEYRKDGTLLKEEEYQRGTKMGKRVSYYEDGKQIAELEHYDEAGNLDGRYFLYQPNGTPIVEGHFSQGKRNGQWIYYYEDGIPLADMTYGISDYHGPFSIHYPDGLNMVKGTFRSGLIDGELTLVNPKGNIISQDPWKFGQNLNKAIRVQDQAKLRKNKTTLQVGNRFIFIQPDTVWIQ